MTEKEKRTLQAVLTAMERNDPNGDYYLYMEDVESGNMTLTECALILINIIKQWREDLNNWRDPKQKALAKYELQLVAML